MEHIDKIIQQKKKFIEIAAIETQNNFVIDDSNKVIVSDIFNYFLNIPGALDLNKGLWIGGDIGTGKSTLIQVFSSFMRFRMQGFKVYSCTTVSTHYARTGELDLFTYNEEGYLKQPVDMCFDELGREPIPTSFFGTKINVMQHIIHIRYELWKQLGLKTFVTTNDDAKDIETKYGDFIRDRRKEMFNIISMTGKSRR